MLNFSKMLPAVLFVTALLDVPQTKADVTTFIKNNAFYITNGVVSFASLVGVFVWQQRRVAARDTQIGNLKNECAILKDAGDPEVEDIIRFEKALAMENDYCFRKLADGKLSKEEFTECYRLSKAQEKACENPDDINHEHLRLYLTKQLNKVAEKKEKVKALSDCFENSLIDSKNFGLNTEK